jgi:SAM-dependent methyltransferase
MWNPMLALAKALEFRLIPPVPDRHPTLEMGFGYGFLSGLLTEKGPFDFGAEMMADKIETAKRSRYHRHYFMCSITDIPLKPASMEAFYFIHSMDHFRDKVSALHEAHRILQPDGEFVFSDITDLWGWYILPRLARLFGLRKLSRRLVDKHLEHSLMHDSSLADFPYEKHLDEMGFEVVRRSYFLRERSAKMLADMRIWEGEAEPLIRDMRRRYFHLLERFPRLRGRLQRFLVEVFSYALADPRDVEFEKSANKIYVVRKKVTP